jgi:hypothetical protein
MEKERFKEFENKVRKITFIVLGSMVGLFLILLPIFGGKKKPADLNPVRSQTTESSATNTKTVSEWKCSICGRTFTHHGYEEISEGVWKPCQEPYQCQICSPECGMKHTNEMNRIMNQVGVKLPGASF